MKKLVAVVVLLLLALNIALLWPKRSACGQESTPTTFEFTKLGLNEIKPGVLPGLIKF